MDQSSKAVFCISTTEFQTHQMVDRLKTAGFSNNDISVLFPDKNGALGRLAGICLLAIPGVGTFVAAGPIMAALGGVALGVTAGGISGALIGMGIPEFEAKCYEGKIHKGNTLISVHSENNEETKRAKEIFEQCSAEDISSIDEAAVKTA